MTSCSRRTILRWMLRLWSIPMLAMTCGLELAGAQPGTDGPPEYVRALELQFGAPSQKAFGSAVFFDNSTSAEELEDMARSKYRYFVGGLWDQWGEDTWMGPWRKVIRGRGPDGIVADLRAIEDAGARQSAEMILSGLPDPKVAQQALSRAFDDPTVESVMAFSIGDSDALSGILLAARRGNGEAVFLVFLLD